MRPTAAESPTPTVVAVEQREWPRARVNVLVRVLRQGESTPNRYVMENLSAGGALLVEGPALEVGVEVQLLMLLGKRTLGVRAQVVRAQADADHSPGSAVRFLDVSAKNQDLIQSYVLTSLKRGAAQRRRDRRS